MLCYRESNHSIQNKIVFIFRPPLYDCHDSSESAHLPHHPAQNNKVVLISQQPTLSTWLY